MSPDIEKTTNLIGEQVWTPVGLNVPGDAGGAAVNLRVTNAHDRALYRTGVKLP